VSPSEDQKEEEKEAPEVEPPLHESAIVPISSAEETGDLLVYTMYQIYNFFFPISIWV
jgi:hypothetical protein